MQIKPFLSTLQSYSPILSYTPSQPIVMQIETVFLITFFFMLVLTTIMARMHQQADEDIMSPHIRRQFIRRLFKMLKPQTRQYVYIRCHVT